jgi:hypothetical protein
MAVVDVLIGDVKSLGTTAVTQINILGAPNDITFLPTVITGTLKVSTQPTMTNSYAWPVGKVAPQNCQNGFLYVQQGSNGDTWVMNAIFEPRQ